MSETCNILCMADTVEVKGGAPVQVTLSVPCRLVEVGPLPRAGSFELMNGNVVTYAGYDGGAWVRSSALGQAGGTKDGHRDWLRQRNLLPVPRGNHPATGKPVTPDMRKGYVDYAQAGIIDEFDREPLDGVAARIERVVAGNIVVSDGQILVRAPLPTWHAAIGHGGAGLSISPGGSYQLGGMGEFGITRRDDAVAFSERWRTRFEGAPENPGRVLDVDTAFVERDDRVEVAVRAGRFVTNQLRFALDDMSAAMVRHWHSAAHAAVAAASGLPWDHEEVLRDIAALIEFGEDKANRGNTRTDGIFWDAHRIRIFDFEGVEPNPAPAAAPAPV